MNKGDRTMKMDELAALTSQQHHATASPEVFQKIGTITRLLHDALTDLGVMLSLIHI